MQKVMCAMRDGDDAAPRRPADRAAPCATNSSSSDSPVMTSGMTSGAVVMPASSVRPRNAAEARQRQPASVPSTTATRGAETTAMRIDSQAASRIWSLLQQLAVPLERRRMAASHTVTSRESLNEKTTIERIGT